MVAWLFACAAQPQRQDDALLIADGVYFHLLPSTVFEQAKTITQKVSIQYQDKQNVFIARIEIDPRGFIVVALTELGQTIFTLQYLDNRLNIDKTFISARMPDLKYLLADLQLIYWPLTLLQDQLNSGDVKVVETGASSVRRALQVQGRHIVDIEYSADVGFASHVTFTHHERGYTIRADVLQTE